MLVQIESAPGALSVPLPSRDGGMAERTNARLLKSRGASGPRGFESHSLRSVAWRDIDGWSHLLAGLDGGRMDASRSPDGEADAPGAWDPLAAIR
jgi:hypothetical protein